MMAKLFADTIAETIGFDIPAHRAALKAYETGDEADCEAMLAEVEALNMPQRAQLWAKFESMKPNIEKICRTYAQVHGYEKL